MWGAIMLDTLESTDADTLTVELVKPTRQVSISVTKNNKKHNLGTATFESFRAALPMLFSSHLKRLIDDIS